jgi:hypothetical protein
MVDRSSDRLVGLVVHDLRHARGISRGARARRATTRAAYAAMDERRETSSYGHMRRFQGRITSLDVDAG